jgi:hypothetical protein
MFYAELTMSLNNAAREVAAKALKESGVDTTDRSLNITQDIAGTKLSACQVYAKGVLLACRDGSSDKEPNWIHPLLVHAAKIHGFKWIWEEKHTIRAVPMFI